MTARIEHGIAGIDPLSVEGMSTYQDVYEDILARQDELAKRYSR